MAKISSASETYPDDVIERRREAALKRMLNTPPVRHAESAPSRKKKNAKGRPIKPKSAAI
jgi:hypothetical protein